MAGYYSEVREFVSAKVDAGVIVRVDWLTQEFINSKSDVTGDDLPFYRHCATAHIQEMVRRVVGKYDVRSKQDDPQTILPGFEHLQRAYTVIRDGANLLVPIDQLNDSELQARADEYDAMAKGCRAHAMEIRQYIEERAQPILVQAAQ